MDERKIEEREFHDRLRAVHEQDPDTSHHYLTNKKYYEVTRQNAQLFDEWIQKYGPGKDALEFGCGSGGLSLIAAKLCKSVVGIDISPESVEVAKGRARDSGMDVRFLEMDGEAMGLPDESFDLVFEGGVLHHVDLQKAVKEIHRVLRPGGRFLLVEALGHNLLIRWYRRLTPHLRTAWETEHIIKMKDIAVFEEFFTIDELRFYHLATLLAVPLRGFAAMNRALDVLEAIDRVVLRIPGIRRWAWQVVASGTKR